MRVKEEHQGDRKRTGREQTTDATQNGHMVATWILSRSSSGCSLRRSDIKRPEERARRQERWQRSPAARP